MSMKNNMFDQIIRTSVDLPKAKADSLLKNEADDLQNHWQNTTEFSHEGYEAFKDGRRRFLAEKIVSTKPKSVLEIGCFGGYNLRHINSLDPSIELTGFDINEKALDYAKKKLPSLNAVNGSIYDLADYFRENCFDVVFTAGVLIHIPCLSKDSTSFIKRVVGNIIKVSSNFVFHAEHHGPEYMKIPTKGMRYIHDFNDLYKDFGNVEIEEAPDASNGFEQLVKVTLN